MQTNPSTEAEVDEILNDLYVSTHGGHIPIARVGSDEEADVLDFRAANQAINQLIAQKCKEVEKAYGGCRRCYGKGYATVKSQIVGYGTDGDIGGYEGTYKRDTPVQMKYCSCNRGKQLAELNGSGREK